MTLVLKRHALKLGTRSSPLALVQTELVKAALLKTMPDLIIEVVTFETKGDVERDASIEDIGGRGVFTDELDDAVMDGTVDAAVHSVKDLPMKLRTGTLFAAMLEREDPREAFVSHIHANLAAVPAGGVFGSASVRRTALLKAIRPDAQFALLRGNVGERVASLPERGLDGTILAVAGLKRLGLQGHIREILEPEALMPDPGQAAIGVIARHNDLATRRIFARIDHAPTSLAVTAERALLAGTAAHAVCGCLATITDDIITLRAVAADDTGAIRARGEISGSPTEAAALGTRLAQTLVQKILQERVA
ncbi:MAG: hydroxymethylbilane synthase [Rhodospirillaceae bacterium]|nr:hydroxymethylbilane synthase [Rhodospirillaceae bacterium]